MKRHNKLVRDKIPDICEAAGEVPTVHILRDDKEYLKSLIDKLFEEAAEVKENPCLEELADALEVIRAIGSTLGHTPEQIEAARAEKAAQRGGFEQRIFLISTDSKQ